jgi:hypothetical protein
VKEPAEFTFAVRKAMDAASGPVRPYEVDYCDFLVSVQRFHLEPCRCP